MKQGYPGWEREHSPKYRKISGNPQSLELQFINARTRSIYKILYLYRG